MASSRRPPKLALQPISPLAMELINEDRPSGCVTAPIEETRPMLFSNLAKVHQQKQQQQPSQSQSQSSQGPPRRHYSLGQASRPPRPQIGKRQRIRRQHTLSGDSNTSSIMGGGNVFSRALSRTYTMTSNASSSIATDEWRKIFDRYDVEYNGRPDGRIPVDGFRKILEDDPMWVETIPKEVQDKILASADPDDDGYITADEFIQLANGRHIPGFGRRRRRALRELLRQTVEFIVPYKYQYQNQYSCHPPPLFMLSISLIQVVIFAYNSTVSGVGLNGPVLYCSNLIFDPDKRSQLWRYLTYMLIHSGLFHAIFNILVQLVLGIPLEMVHGWWRVMMVYFSGVIAGSLWTSVCKPDKFLSGASGGVYALITAHLGTVVMNYREMSCPWCRVIVVLIVAVTDVAVYIYDMYMSPSNSTYPVSYAAHISGAIAGLLVGITCLKNLRWEKHERYIWAISALIFVLLIGTAIVWSVAFPSHFPGIRHEKDIPCVPEPII